MSAKLSTNWNANFRPPPGIRPVTLASVTRAWRELHEVKAQLKQAPSSAMSPHAKSYLAGVEALKKAINAARMTYRDQVAWAGPVAF